MGGFERYTHAEASEIYRRFCDEKEFPFYPQFMKDLPFFCLDINNFISDRGKRDLSEAQFRGDVSLDCLWGISTQQRRDLGEMNGILGYSDIGITELKYTPPEKTQFKTSNGKIIEVISSIDHSFDSNELDSEKAIIIYHSHPIGDGKLELADVVGMYHITRCIDISKKDFFFNLYIPKKDKTYWYKATPTCSSTLSRN